jgi:hypothetical protein
VRGDRKKIMGARGGGEKEREGVYVHKIDINIRIYRYSSMFTWTVS